MSLSKQILIGLEAGVSVGLFFGERVSFLRWPAKGFVPRVSVPEGVAQGAAHWRAALPVTVQSPARRSSAGS